MFDDAKSWPFQEARKLIQHIGKKGKVPGDQVTFETGYGPSGAPHIGTFGEVVRTLWVMRAFRELTDNAYPVRLIMFSDDYDALRQVPDDQPDWMKQHIGQPLSLVPNPYKDVHASSFAMANNLKLMDFVGDILAVYDTTQRVIHTDNDNYMDEPGIYFCSASNFYCRGRFDDDLTNVWDNYKAIQDIMLPTLGEERRATYSPFMPVMQGHVRHDARVELAAEQGWISYYLNDIEMRKAIYGGNTKLQWKVDWAMRWRHFDVDYEMSGKDLIDSVKASSKICRALGGVPPLNLTYELFLDEYGAKISKSKGNGFTVAQWLTYGSIGGLMLFMFQDPRKAKKLYRDLVPQIEDQYLKLRTKVATPDDANWHFTRELKDPLVSDINYALLLNLGIVSQASTENQLLAYLQQNREIPEDEMQVIRLLSTKVLQYAIDSGRIGRARRQPTPEEAAAFKDLADRFDAMLPNMTAEHYQFQVYEVGKLHNFEPLRTWFQALYECLLGNSDGPRFGAFTVAYGLRNTVALLRQYESVDA